MARYIDADALIKKIFPYDVVDPKCYTINAKMIYQAIQEAPTADVVPKSEVFLASSDAMKMLIECHGYALTHDADVRREVAREIFEEIRAMLNRPFTWGEFDELKKKYTEET